MRKLLHRELCQFSRLESGKSLKMHGRTLLQKGFPMRYLPRIRNLSGCWILSRFDLASSNSAFKTWSLSLQTVCSCRSIRFYPIERAAYHDRSLSTLEIPAVPPVSSAPCKNKRPMLLYTCCFSAQSLPEFHSLGHKIAVSGG
jgi:hypothetical protein